MPFGGLSHVDARDQTLEGSRSRTGRGTYEGRHVPAVVSYVPTHECIAHCSSADGECACPTHTADKCIYCRESDKMAMRLFATLLRTAANFSTETHLYHPL